MIGDRIIQNPLIVVCSDRRINDQTIKRVLSDAGIRNANPYVYRILGGALIFGMLRRESFLCHPEIQTHLAQFRRFIEYGIDGIVLTAHGGGCLEAINNFELYSRNTPPEEEKAILTGCLNRASINLKNEMPGNFLLIQKFIFGEWLIGSH